MVIVRVKCGLGNQLFQIAAAHALARRCSTGVAVDLSWFEGSRARQRPCLLSACGIDLPTPDHESVRRIMPYQWAKLWPFGSQERVIRPATGDTGFERIRQYTQPDAYLDGYWQGEAFFTEAIDYMRAAKGRFSAPTLPGWESLVAKLQEPTTLAFHVRRTDLVTGRDPSRVLGALPPAYYAEALDWHEKEHPVKQIMVFSDDPAWCREHLKFGPKLIVIDSELSPAGSWHDFFALAHARRLVIGNSSFSWWAAWFAESDPVRIVGPSGWYRDPAFSEWNKFLQLPRWHWL